MPQVHIRGTRHGVNRESVASAIQRYTGLGLVDARKAAEAAISGKQTSLYVDDFHEVYELADVLTGMGLEAEADEGDY